MNKFLTIFRALNPFAIDNTRYLKLFVSIYPGIAAVLLAFYKDPIVNSSRLARQLLQGQTTGMFSINWWVLLYWILLIFWIMCYFTFVTNESLANKKTTEGIKSAIFRSPNPKVYAEYDLYYKQIMAQLSQIDPANPLKYEDNMRKILSIICLLTGTYISRKDTDEIYGANIMLYIPLSLQKNMLEKIQTKEDQWIHFKQTKLDAFNGILYLVPELTHKSGDSSTGNFSPGFTISLPVVSETNSGHSDILEKNIPGAPRAAVASTGIYLFSDVNDEHAYDLLGLPEVQNAQKYWLERLPGTKSIISFRIPHIWQESNGSNNILKLIGVLNIDSTKSDILGTDIEYHTTFYSLMYPILCQLGPVLANYYKSYLPKIDEKLV